MQWRIWGPGRQPRGRCRIGECGRRGDAGCVRPALGDGATPIPGDAGDGRDGRTLRETAGSQVSRDGGTGRILRDVPAPGESAGGQRAKQVFPGWTARRPTSLRMPRGRPRRTDTSGTGDGRRRRRRCPIAVAAFRPVAPPRPCVAGRASPRDRRRGPFAIAGTPCPANHPPCAPAIPGGWAGPTAVGRGRPCAAPLPSSPSRRPRRGPSRHGTNPLRHPENPPHRKMVGKGDEVGPRVPRGDAVMFPFGTTWETLASRCGRADRHCSPAWPEEAEPPWGMPSGRPRLRPSGLAANATGQAGEFPDAPCRGMVSPGRAISRLNVPEAEFTAHGKCQSGIVPNRHALS